MSRPYQTPVPPGRATLASRKPSVVKVSRAPLVTGMIEKAPALAVRSKDAARQAANATSERLGTAARTTLRFWQFFKAYVQAFAVGLGCFWLLLDALVGHFNPVMIIVSHIGSLIVAPFYALMLAPFCFGLYCTAANFNIPFEWRAYFVSCFMGVSYLASRIMSGKFLIGGDLKSDGYAVSMVLCGLAAGYTFNRAAQRILEKEAAALSP